MLFEHDFIPLHDVEAKAKKNLSLQFVICNFLRFCVIKVLKSCHRNILHSCIEAKQDKEN
jgi:hypothetical protein